MEYVRFCNYPEKYPIEVLGIIKLRSNNLIGIRQFTRLMRRFGISYTRALIYQGCYERGEFEVITETGLEDKELESKLKEIETKVVDEYRFRFVIRVKYQKRKGHELFLEAVVEGTFEKTAGIPEPTEEEIRRELKDNIMLKFEEFMVDFFTHTSTAYLELVRNGELDGEFEEFEVVGSKAKKIDEELSGEITYTYLSLGRSETGRWVDRPDLANAMLPYMEDALLETIDYIMRTEATYLTISARRMYDRLREFVKKSEEKLISVKIKERISVAKNITDLEDLLKYINELLEKGKISYEDYQNYFLAIQVKAREILNEQLMKWIERIDRCKSIAELNEVMSRIMKTTTYRSVFFDPLRVKLEEEYIRKLNELARIEIPKGIISRKDVYKAVLTRYLDKLSELVKTGYENVHMLRRVIVRLRRTIRRVERSKLPEDVKAKIVSEYESKITELIEYACKHYKELIPKIQMISQLNNVQREIERNKRYLKICYDELSKLIRQKRKELTKQMYKELTKELLSATPTELKQMQHNLFMLPIRTQYSVFKELLSKAENLEVLYQIYSILLGSDIAKNPKYEDYYVRLRGIYNKRRSELLWK